jgi:hypothetical protein
MIKGSIFPGVFLDKNDRLFQFWNIYSLLSLYQTFDKNCNWEELNIEVFVSKNINSISNENFQNVDQRNILFKNIKILRNKLSGTTWMWHFESDQYLGIKHFKCA